MAVERDERGRWVKGSSGNPKGKSRQLPPELLKAFQTDAVKAVSNLRELMNDEDPNIRLAATKFFIDKCVGTRFQAFLDEDNTTDEDITIRIVSAAEERERRTR